MQRSRRSSLHLTTDANPVATAKPGPRAPTPSLSPAQWRVMHRIWQHGPLTVAEVHRMSAAQGPSTLATLLEKLVAKGYLTTTLEPSSPTGGRPKKRYHPCVDYSTSLERVVRKFFADYLFGDPAGLSFLAQTVQQSLSAADESLQAPDSGFGRHLSHPSD